MTKISIKKKVCTATMVLVTTLASMTSGANAQEKEIIYNRIAGPDRYHTSNEISGPLHAKTLILANGNNYADALSASALVAKENGAIYLTNGKTFDQYLDYKFTSFVNGFDKVIIVGGISSVSTHIESKLKSYVPNTIRIAGKDRYETSTKIAEYIGNFEKAFVATGLNYADALSAGAISAQKGYPILLTNGNELNSKAKELVENNNSETYILGGEKVVSNKVLQSIKNSKRIQGENRYETNAKIIEEFRSILDTSKAYVASGNTFPDALAGSGLAGRNKNPLILTDTTPNDVTKDLVKSLDTGELIALGGMKTLSLQTLEQLASKSVKPSNSEVKIKDIEKYIKDSKKYSKGRPPFTDLTYTYDDLDTMRANIAVDLIDNEYIDSREYGAMLYNEITIRVNKYDENTLKEVKILLSKIFPSTYNEVYDILGEGKKQERFVEGKRVDFSEGHTITIIFKEPILHN